MGRQNVSRRGVKARRANSSPVQNCEKVNRKSFLPVESPKEWTTLLAKSRTLETSNLLRKKAFVAFDSVMDKKQRTQWFKNRCLTLDAPAGIPVENVIIGGKRMTGQNSKRNVNLCIHGTAQVEIPLSKDEKRFPWFTNPPYMAEFRKPVLFYAQFNPFRIQAYSWVYLAQFLKFVYHPMTYIKEVEMFAVNQNFIDSLKCNIDSLDNEPRYIRCESFSLEEMRNVPDANPADLSYSLKWIAGNVRAETIRIPTVYDENYELFANFLLDPSGAKQCASEKMEIHMAKPAMFLSILIEKFRTIPLVEGDIPTIVLKYPRHENYSAHLGPNLIDQEVDSDGADALHIISNGQNRMRISFRWENNSNSDCKIRVYPI
ncbi:hypothetical protein Ddc_24018 [Ditylenchus destructor]|nr:hypothetical protein Ddc_24018 [Ditylenchus destructor]